MKEGSFMIEILTTKQMGEAEQSSVKLGVSLAQLMDNAGEMLGREVLLFAQEKMLRNIVILIGNGNNGGDGSVCANYLAESGAAVTVVKMCREPKTELSKVAFEKIHNEIRIISCEDNDFNEVMGKAEIIVDCVFGTGFHGEIREKNMSYFETVAESKAYKIGCDVPSGVNSDNGYVSKGTVKCIKTITFHRAKLGMFLSPAKDYCGEIIVRDIKIPDGWEEFVSGNILKPSFDEIKSFLPKRNHNSHKGTYGKLMLVCGCENYMGAAFISASAALRSGVGIGNLCTPRSVVHALVSAMPECVLTGLDPNKEGYISSENIDKLIELSRSAAAMVIGCGLGACKDTEKLVCELIKNVNCPIILDADGINCLSKHIDILKEKQGEIILTPHPAELARLCNVDLTEVISNRIKYAKSLVKKYGVTVHAKGTQTITVTADAKCYLTDFGNTALAKGGSGDMLAGLIGSFVAQRIAFDKSCILASCLMGKTAEVLAEENSERGILARDIINAFPKVLKEWEE